jgi:hypothetical protein
MLLRIVAGESLESTRVELATSLVVRKSCLQRPSARTA